MSDIAPSRILHPGELAQHPLNSNTHSPAHIKELAESRKTFGQYRNIVVWTCPETIETENARGEPVTLKKGITYVLAGNGFHQAAMLRGDTEIEVKDRSDLSFDESLLLIEADNASPLGSQPDPAQLRANLERARTLTVDRPGLEAMLERVRAKAGAWDGEVVDDPLAEWRGMPEFENESKAQRTLYIHFENDESVEEFSNLIGQPITDKTKSLWYPYKPDNLHMDKDLIYKNVS